MNRVLIYSQEQLRLYDLLEMAKHPLVSVGFLAEDFLGLGGSNMVAGFAPTYNSNLTITFGTGRLYTLQVVDATIYGGTPNGLAADSNIIAQQGENPLQTLTFSTALLSSGQALYALVEVSYAQTDVIDAADPTSGLLTYLNPSNPLVPWIGPGNDGIPQSTTRAAKAVLTIKYGAAATSGAQVPPTPDSGNVPLYLVTLSFGQTSITSANVVVAGPSAAVNVPSNYPQAPFIAGLLNSHHSGDAGQAPKIKLASEIQGVMPLGNLPATDTVGVLPTVQVYAGNPNTHVAGAVQDFVWDSTHLVLWECTTTGNAAAAVWNGVSHKTLNNTLDNGSGVMILAGALTINGAAGTYREVLFDTASTLRWRVATNTAAESGSNAGSDFQVNAYSDAGSLLSTPLTITRSTGKITTGGGNTLDDGSGIVTGSGNVPAGVTGISGMMTVMLPAPVVLVSAITIDGANHTVNIGTAYPNAKIAILTIYGSVNPGSGSIDSLDISFAPSGTPGLSEFLMTVVGSPTAASWTNSQTIFVGLTPGSNPSFVYSASTTTGGSTGAIRLIGFIQ